MSYRVTRAHMSHIVRNLQRGFVDEEQGAFHEVQQAALRLVHAAHIWRAARGVEVVRGVEFDAADELEELGDELVRLVRHGGLQLAVVALGEHGLEGVSGVCDGM